MPGQKPKAQHFVQRAYLEGFQDPELEKNGKEFVWLYMPRKSPFRQRPDVVARRNYYYCYNDEAKRKFDAEHGLQKLEDLALPILRELRDKRFALKKDDRLTFAGYVALAHTRVPTFERSINRRTALVSAKQLEFVANDKRALERVVTKIREETGENVDPEEYRKKLVGGTVELTQANRGWSVLQMFKMMVLLQETIFSMNWTFLVAPEGDPGFLTSDNPVSLFDPMGGLLGGVGFRSSPAALFTFPLSRNVCLRARHTPAPQTVELNSSEVRYVNKGTVMRADSQLYAPFKSEPIQKLFDREISRRAATGKTGKVLLSMGRVVEE